MKISQKVYQFRNCCIMRDHRIFQEDLWVRNGKIINPEPLFFDEKNYADVQIDCNGAVIAPGFIDVQINGGFGVDFSVSVDRIEEEVQKVARGILAHGVTSFCPTVVTSPPHIYHKILPQIKKTAGGHHGAGVLGIHIEGPFISREKKGAHPVQHIRTFEKGFQTVEEVYGQLDNICMVTIAPELEYAADITRQLSDRGICVSIGHSMGSLQDGEKAVENGASFITHLFNAMLPFHHRDPGLVGLLASNFIPKGKTVYYGIIADGIHTHPAALRIAHRTHPEGLVLVTDAISAMGLDEGVHTLGQQTVQIKGRRATVAGTETLCGSIVTMNQCVKHLMKAAGCSKVEALEAASLHPALALGLHHRKGSLDFGLDADFIFLGDDLEVWSSWIAGQRVYQNPAAPEISFRDVTK